MTDYFAVLRQPRRPWLDPQKLKEEYQRLTLEYHPDAKVGRSTPPGRDPSPPTFAEVNEAYRVLSNPKSRLQHLLSLETSTPADTITVPEELMEPFMLTFSLMRDADKLLQKLHAATTALSKSLLRSEVAALQGRSKQLLKKLQNSYDLAIEKLRQLDEVWTLNKAEAIEQLAILSRRFAYLERWLEQLREKQFQLAN
jgi:curved DNA-binding protein CbpA